MNKSKILNRHDTADTQAEFKKGKRHIRQPILYILRHSIDKVIKNKEGKFLLTWKNVAVNRKKK